jgi:hypothetical protein
MQMNYPRLALSAMGATDVYFALGFVSFALSPLRNEFLKYPALYRSEEGMKSVMPIGMAAMFIAMLVLAAIYALAYRADQASSRVRASVFWSGFLQFARL